MRNRLIVGLLFPVIVFLWMIGWCMSYVGSGSESDEVACRMVSSEDSALTADISDCCVPPIFEGFVEDNEVRAG